MPDLTPADLERLMELAAKATPPPWPADVGACLTDPTDEDHDWYFARGPMIKGLSYEAGKSVAKIDGQFIEASRTFLPRLCAALRAAWADNERLRRLLIIVANPSPTTYSIDRCTMLAKMAREALERKEPVP